MAKRGKKLEPETREEIIKLSKDYGPRYVARHLGLHESTVKRHIELDLQAKVMASRSFQKHSDDLAETLKEAIMKKRSELLHAAFLHFKQEYPEYLHLEHCHEISDELNILLAKMELLANSRGFRFCAECPICQSIKRQLRESA